jgi:NAD-dependent SIR2 family protein deacetylase
MPIYNEKTKCESCGKDLTDNEIVRIGRDKTLRMCDQCWEKAVIQFEKLGPLWQKIGQ